MISVADEKVLVTQVIAGIFMAGGGCSVAADVVVEEGGWSNSSVSVANADGSALCRPGLVCRMGTSQKENACP